MNWIHVTKDTVQWRAYMTTLYTFQFHYKKEDSCYAPKDFAP
jgi:hypothetical protein